MSLLSPVVKLFSLFSIRRVVGITTTRGLELGFPEPHLDWVLESDETGHGGEWKTGPWLWQPQKLFYCKLLSDVWTLVGTLANYWPSSLGVKKKKKERKRKRREYSQTSTAEESEQLHGISKKAGKGKVGLIRDPDIRGPTRKFSSPQAAASQRPRFLDAARLEFSSRSWLPPPHRTIGSVTCN